MDFRYKRSTEVNFDPLNDSKRRELFRSLPDYQDEHIEIARTCRLATDIRFSFDHKPEAKKKFFKDLLTASLKHYQEIVGRKQIAYITDDQAKIYLEKSKSYFPKAEEKGLKQRIEKSKKLLELLEGKPIEKMLHTKNPNTLREIYFEKGSWKND